MSLLTNLKGYWKLDESSGNAADSSGNGNTLVNTNSATFGAGLINNGGYVTKAGKQHFTIADASQVGLDIAGDLTINIWGYLSSVPGATEEYPIIWKGSAYELRYQNSTVPNGFNFRINGAGGQINSTLSTATWYMITIVYTAAAGTADVYQNGSSIGQITGLATSINDTANAFMLGDRIAGGDTTTNWDGRFDEAGIWARVLTAAEITQLYNGGAGLSYSNFAGATGLLPFCTPQR